MHLMEYPPKSIYDTEPDEEPWFVGQKPADIAPTDMPWEVAERRKLVNVDDWLHAENQQGRGLARATAAFARLDERMRGRRSDRLALLEVTELLWASGSRLESEKLALYIHLRESTIENAQMLSMADWAVRRLLGKVSPVDGLLAFLGRHRAEYDGLAEANSRAVGIEFDGIAEEWLRLVDHLKDAHPFTKSAAAFHAWRVFGLSEPGAVLEAAVAAGKLSASEGRNIPFVPLGLGDRYMLGRGGSVSERLTAWYTAVENACLRGLMMMDQLEYWRERASMATKDLSGKTPPALIEAFIATPVLSVTMAAEMTGASKAAIQRNFSKFNECGLIYEITGQGRYRFWKTSE